jgi:hypothetical protein
MRLGLGHVVILVSQIFGVGNYVSNFCTVKPCKENRSSANELLYRRNQLVVDAINRHGRKQQTYFLIFLLVRVRRRSWYLTASYLQQSAKQCRWLCVCKY